MENIKHSRVARYAKKFLGMESYFRLQLEEWLARIDVTSTRVLDIGGGLNPVKGRTKNWRVEEYKILDNNLEGNFRPDFYLDLDEAFSTIGKPVADRVKRYRPETIFCLEVMEYVIDPCATMRFIFGVLKTGGIAYLSFPSIYPVHKPEAYDSLRYTKQGIIRLLKRAGFSRFEIVARQATKGKNDLDAFFRREKMKAAATPSIYDIGYVVTAYKT